MDGAFCLPAPRPPCRSTEGAVMAEQVGDELAPAVRRELERLFAPLISRATGAVSEQAAAPPESRSPAR